MLSFEISVFPLQLVAVENETVNLHIFEPRYKYLITECFDTGSSFAIPIVVKNKVTGDGMEMRVSSIKKMYENGEMDVSCLVLSRLNILEYFPAKSKNVADKAFVQKISFTDNEDKEQSLRLRDLLDEFYRLAGIEIPDSHLRTFKIQDIIHKCGLSFTEELELFRLSSTAERQIFLVEHLKKIVPLLENIQKTKELVKLNGHFKNLPQSF